MPLYEFVLRTAGRPDEVRISDYNGLAEGDGIRIVGRHWVVAAKEAATGERADRLPVAERIIVVRAVDRDVPGSSVPARA
jgi:hypothetical protein